MNTQIVLSNGLPFDYCDQSTWDNLSIEVIAQSLSRQTRFLGHGKRPYDVATHSLCMSYAVPEQYALAALLHDAPEAVLGDIPSPLKGLHMMAGVRALEQRILTHVYRRFRVPFDEVPVAVHAVDIQAFKVEVAELFDNPEASLWGCHILAPTDVKVGTLRAQSHEVSRLMFLERFEVLFK